MASEPDREQERGAAVHGDGRADVSGREAVVGDQPGVEDLDRRAVAWVGVRPEPVDAAVAGVRGERAAPRATERSAARPRSRPLRRPPVRRWSRPAAFRRRPPGRATTSAAPANHRETSSSVPSIEPSSGCVSNQPQPTTTGARTTYVATASSHLRAIGSPLLRVPPLRGPTPSTGRTAPETYPEVGPSSHATTSATSSGPSDPAERVQPRHLPLDGRHVLLSSSASRWCSYRSVAIRAEGQAALTRMRLRGRRPTVQRPGQPLDGGLGGGVGSAHHRPRRWAWWRGDVDDRAGDGWRSG